MTLPLPLTPETAAEQPKRLVIGVALTIVVVAALWATPFLMPLRLLVTFVHEAGHAVAVNLVGGDVSSLTINPNEGGLTIGSIRDTRLRVMAVASAGYVGATLAGAVLLASLRRLRTGRVVLAGFAASIALASAAWVRWSYAGADAAALRASGSGAGDGRFTLVFALGAIALFGALAWKGPVLVRRVVVTIVSVGLCFGALDDVWQLVGSDRRHSDADTLASVTFLPSIVWAVVWLLVGLAVVGLSVASLVRSGRRPPTAVRTP